MEKFVIIDGTNLFFRAFYALPLMTNFEGEVSNAVYGFVRMLVKVIQEEKPKYIAVALDSGKTFRHEMYADYKGKRDAMPSELRSQFPILKNLLGAMNVKVVEGYGLEADDIIGCLSTQFKNTQNIILSSDKDCFQLINDNTVVMKPLKGVSETVVYDVKGLKKDYGLTPKQIIDYKALSGDPSDNIQGIRGVGEKTATTLLAKYGSLDGIYANIEFIEGKLHDRLLEGKENAYLSRALATIVTDKDLNLSLDDFVYDFPFNNEVLTYFKRYQFNSLLKKESLFNAIKEEGEEFTYNQVKITSQEQLENVHQDAKNQQEIAVHYEANIFSVAFGDKEYNVHFDGDFFEESFSSEGVLNLFKDILESDKIGKIVFDAKSFKHLLHKIDIKLNNVTFDTIVGRYLLNLGGKSTVSFNTVVDENLLPEGVYAYNLLALKDIYLKKIKEQGLEQLFNEIEIPLIDVLFNMEIQGFKIDVVQLKLLREKYEKELEDLSNQVYEMVGCKFNLNSPKQIYELLFNKLILKPVGRTKSTNKDILDEMRDQHPVVDLILRYRHISKIYTTYIVAFRELLNIKNNKIYTVFNQTLTTTGRLSSSEPNLQNIPVRTEEGRTIRKIFIPTHEDGYIVSADYSQIELRLLAAFSGDERMINAFNNNIDIHALTANEIFGVPVEDVTPEQRRAAKGINFGIIYGISEYGLSKSIKVSYYEANDYIKKYFSRYPKIEEYMNGNIEYCKKHGFVKTMFGRIRNIPEIYSNKRTTLRFGERAAMNMPLQGSASDIIKLSMIRVFDEFQKRGLKSKLILQVHDELLVDAVADEVEIVKIILKDCMENVVDLPVKLDVNIEAGKNWYEAK